jgi:hypothetical protein
MINLVVCLQICETLPVIKNLEWVVNGTIFSVLQSKLVIGS